MTFGALSLVRRGVTRCIKGPAALLERTGFLPEVMASLGDLLDSHAISLPRGDWRSWCEREIARGLLGASSTASSERSEVDIRSLTLDEALSETSGLVREG